MSDTVDPHVIDAGLVEVGRRNFRHRSIVDNQATRDTEGRLLSFEHVARIDLGGDEKPLLARVTVRLREETVTVEAWTGRWAPLFERPLAPRPAGSIETVGSGADADRTRVDEAIEAAGADATRYFVKAD